MSLSHQRRQHPSLEHHQFNNLSLHELPLRTSIPTSNFLSPVPAESDIAKLSHSPSSTLESSPAISNFDYSESADYYMPRGYAQNQPARSQPSNSRPTSTQPLSNSVLSFDHGAGAQQASWISHNNAANLISQPRFRLNEQHFHKRHSSESTVTSAGPNSPFTPATADSPYIVDAESQALYPQHLESFDQSNLPSATSYPKAIPPPNPNFSDSFLFSPQYQNISTQYAENQSLWEQAMRQDMSHQQQHQQQQQHNPHVNGGYRMSQPSQGLSGDLNGHGNANAMMRNHLRSAATDRNRLPHLDRTMSDIYQDELYNPAEPTVPAPTSKPSPPTAKFQGKLVSPRNNVISERLQAAGQDHIARSSSPTTAVSREKSPFRPNSKFAAEGYPGPTSPMSRLGSASQIRERQKIEAEALAMAQHSQPQAVVNEKTVSPKEVSLEYEPDEEADDQLIPDLHSPQHAHARSQPPSKLKQELTQPGYDSMSELRRESSSMSSGSSSLRQNGISRVPQQYPFISQQRRQNGNTQRSQESVPEFPAPMLSMESTKSERLSVHSASSSQSSSSESDVQRPPHTTADTGTYTCTYHGCTQRFESQSKLQKHKRDGHRQGTPSSAGGESKNTQAGPHKCERINPITGKPCNSIFSRPYDLTRHEDTIHNARKQKVKCQLCVEDKTFSRNDALTRHMRVVHPEVDFPGKITKRGRV
ncbi:hypothetical protein MMC10_007418 [Thelotrema lepadinum]|nr:hypothetical protein [Thelotrema lepadinum]